MNTVEFQRRNVRMVTVFAAAGAVGPLLIPLLIALGSHSQFYDPLYALIAAICPAWILGPLEYSYGKAVTYIVIFLSNVTIWSILGIFTALPCTRLATSFVWGSFILLAVAYANEMYGSIWNALPLLIVMACAYLIGKRVGASPA